LQQGGWGPGGIAKNEDGRSGGGEIDYSGTGARLPFDFASI
jgi:hypothetical protein